MFYSKPRIARFEISEIEELICKSKFICNIFFAVRVHVNFFRFSQSAEFSTVQFTINYKLLVSLGLFWFGLTISLIFWSSDLSNFIAG